MMEVLMKICNTVFGIYEKTEIVRTKVLFLYFNASIILLESAYHSSIINYQCYMLAQTFFFF